MTTWLLTTTFCGQWLSGDSRGSVTNVRDRRPGDRATPVRIKHANCGDTYEPAIAGLQRAALEQIKGPPVTVDLRQAEQLLDQFLETAEHRRWTIFAVSLMANHLHLVVEAPPVVGKTELLRDFKSHGSRRLNRLFGSPTSGTWWTDGGSCRPIRRLSPAVFYTCHRQPSPLVLWSRERGRIPPSESDRRNVYSGVLGAAPHPASEPSFGEPPSDPPSEPTT